MHEPVVIFICRACNEVLETLSIPARVIWGYDSGFHIRAGRGSRRRDIPASWDPVWDLIGRYNVWRGYRRARQYLESQGHTPPQWLR